MSRTKAAKLDAAIATNLVEMVSERGSKPRIQERVLKEAIPL